MPSGYWHHIEYLEGGYGLSVRTIAPTFPLKVKAIINLTIQRKFDELMRKTLKKKWFEIKLKIAEKRAQKEMQRIQVSAN